MVALQHELVQLCGAARILRDLFAGLRIEDCEASVDVPTCRVNPHGEVDLDVLNPTDVPRAFPGELLHGVPGFAHREEGGMGDGLSVGGDAVVLTRCQVNMFAVKAAEDRLDFSKGGIGCAVLDQDLRRTGK